MPAKSTPPKSSTKAATRKPGIRRRRAEKITRDEIAARAYYLHLDGGGDAVENWLRAERELAA